jgi:hypothetical protein
LARRPAWVVKARVVALQAARELREGLPSDMQVRQKLSRGAPKVPPSGRDLTAGVLLSRLSGPSQSFWFLYVRRIYVLTGRGCAAGVAPHALLPADAQVRAVCEQAARAQAAYRDALLEHQWVVKGVRWCNGVACSKLAGLVRSVHKPTSTQHPPTPLPPLSPHPPSPRPGQKSRFSKK